MTRIALLAAVAVLASCSPAPHEASPPVPTVIASVSASAAPRVSPRLSDPRWIQAKGDDPLDKARLASEVGAAELLAGVEDGGDIEAVALAALPYADDAEVALGRLAEIARADPARRGRVLVAILGIAGKTRRQREPLDLEGARRAGEAMVALASDRALTRDQRALAVSAARALAEKGYVAPARIPSDLDPDSR